MNCDAHLDPARGYLVGVSGGRDSVALLHWLLESGIKKLVVCHLNHGLRGRESGQDALFVRRLAKRHGLPLESGKCAVARLSQREGLSLETAARRARYNFFANCARNRRLPRLILAHHADDQAETVLFNLLRGSAGPKGMRPVSRRRIDGYQLSLFRPWLNRSRAEINAYLAEHQLKFREDSSNRQSIATRNRLRHEALPLLADILGRDTTRALCRAAAHQSELDETLEQLLDQLDLLDPQGRLFLPKLQQLTPLLQRQALLRYLHSHRVPDIDRATLDRARDLLIPGGPHALTLPKGRQLRRKEGRVFLKKASTKHT